MRLFVFFFLMTCVTASPAARIQDARPLMGTVVEVIAEGAEEPALRAAAEGAFREMRRLSDMMSHYDPASVVSAINEAAEGETIVITRHNQPVAQLARGQELAAALVLGAGKRRIVDLERHADGWFVDGQRWQRLRVLPGTDCVRNIEYVDAAQHDEPVPQRRAGVRRGP